MPDNVFNSYRLVAYETENTKNLINEINRQEDSYILKVNREKYLDHLVDRFSIGEVTIKYDDIYMEPYERQISGEELPPGKWIDRKKS
jgi:hypothetical protein